MTLFTARQPVHWINKVEIFEEEWWGLLGLRILLTAVRWGWVRIGRQCFPGRRKLPRHCYESMYMVLCLI